MFAKAATASAIKASASLTSSASLASLASLASAFIFANSASTSYLATALPMKCITKVSPISIIAAAIAK